MESYGLMNTFMVLQDMTRQGYIKETAEDDGDRGTMMIVPSIPSHYDVYEYTDWNGFAINDGELSEQIIRNATSIENLIDLGFTKKARED